MNKRSLTILITTCVLLLSPFAEAAKVDAYKIKKKDFKKQVETIALAPPEALQQLSLPPATGRLIEQEISRVLSRKGYTVLPSSVFQKIRDTMKQQVGGYKLPDGSDDLEKMRAVREHSHRELLFQHPVDAVLGIHVRLVAAPFEKDKASWDGITQKVQKSDNSLYDLMGGGKYSGNIGAASLRLSFWDRDENLLYSHAGGIELVMMRNGKLLEPLPTAGLLKDEKRIKSSVKIALKPF